MNISIRLFLIYIVFHLNVNAQNVLLNPGFDSEDSQWDLFGGQIQSNQVKSGRNSLYIYNPEGSPKWSGAHQEIVLQESTNKVIVGGWIKTAKVVQGANPWEMARIAVEFLDANNQLVGGYPPSVVQLIGTNDWKYYTFEYNVPKGAKSLKVQLALANCIGEAWFDDCNVLLFDSLGKIQTASVYKGITDYGKWVPMYIDSNSYTGHFIDWSHLLDAPAGKHGFLKTNSQGELIFEDHTKIRFLGVNLVASTCFPETHALTDSLVLRLSKLGCNIVRLHHMDAPWSVPNIFGSKVSSLKLDPIQLEKVDYLIAALKKKGIYVFLDFLVHREFYTKDGASSNLPDLGGKQVGYFDSIIIDKQQDYIKQWMLHLNPYTKLMYKDEPAIVASEFINESTVFTHFAGDLLNTYYRNELNSQFKKQYQNEELSIFDLSYDSYSSPILKVRNNGSNVNHSLDFLNSIERRYYAKMYAYSRNIGIKYLLSGSNMPMPILSYQNNNRAMDLMLTNEYWDHPQVWKINNDWDRVEYAPIINLSAIKQYNKSSVFAISKYQWSNKPLIVTEYNACYPNEFMLEALPMVLAYGNLQQINGIIHFAYDNKQIGKDPLRSFDVSTNPNHLANWAICVPMFQYQYVNNALNVAYDYIDTIECYQLPNYSDYIDKESYLPYVTKVEKSTNNKETPHGTYSKFHNVTTGEIISDTKELNLNYVKGCFSIHTAKMQGATGQLNEKLNEFKYFNFTTSNPWVGVFIISTSNQSLEESNELLLMVNMPTKLTGQTYNASHSAIEKMGEYPFLMQQFEGTITIKTNKNVEVIAYTIQGKVIGKIHLNTDANGNVTFDPSVYNSMIFKIIKK
jgi:hypothetical protein